MNTKTASSGTYALETSTSTRPRSDAPPAPVDLIAQELRARLAAAPLSELVALLRDSAPPPAPLAPSKAPAPAGAPTVRSLIRRVLGRTSLHSQEVVARVQALRPGTPGPTVRSDLSRMRVEGELKAVGPVRGGKLRIG